MKIWIDRLLKALVLEWLIRILLGAVFVYACVHKILHPDAFAKILYGYKVIPAFFINPIAITMPFVELICGLSLLLGVFPKASSLLINAMLLIFIMAISYNLIRGLSFDCGCFTVHKAGVYSDPREVLMRDLLFFTMALVVIFHRGSRLLCLKDTLHD